MKITTRSLVISGLFIALSIVLTRIFSQQMMIAGVPASRLSIGFLPIILSGIILGPIWGFAVGVIADALGFVIFPPAGAFYFWITINSGLVGLLPALIVRFTGKTPNWAKVLLSVSTVQIICSAFLQTYFLSMLLGRAFEILFLPRAIVSLIMIPVYYLLAYSILLGLKRAKLIPQQLGSRAAGGIKNP